jgi:hypothetical protein
MCVLRFYFNINFLYIKPDLSPQGPKHVAYTETHSCVSRYLTDYLLNIGCTTG